MIKLDLGAGIWPRGEDFICVDRHQVGRVGRIVENKVEQVDAPEYRWTQAELGALPFLTGRVDEIWSAHALEHFAVSEIAPMLREWLRVLRPGGRLILQVPNFDYAARYWFTGPDRTWAEMLIFGGQTHAGDFHKCAFTAATLKSDMEAAGFTVSDVRYLWNHNQETLQAVGKKPRDSEIRSTS